MRPRTTSIAAFWPALLGVLASHQIAYSGHDDGHVHGYLETIGPALVVAGVLGWIWSWARARVEFRSVLRIQFVLFAVMESSERLATATGFAVSDLSPIGIALVMLSLGAALTVFADRVVESIGSDEWSLVQVGGGDLIDHPTSAARQQARVTTWSIRAPPSLV